MAGDLNLHDHYDSFQLRPFYDFTQSGKGTLELRSSILCVRLVVVSRSFIYNWRGLNGCRMWYWGACFFVCTAADLFAILLWIMERALLEGTQVWILEVCNSLLHSLKECWIWIITSCFFGCWFSATLFQSKKLLLQCHLCLYVPVIFFKINSYSEKGEKHSIVAVLFLGLSRLA